MYATTFTQEPLLLTLGTKELRLVVCRHCLVHVDTVCSTRSAMVDNTGMLYTAIFGKGAEILRKGPLPQKGSANIVYQCIGPRR